MSPEAEARAQHEAIDNAHQTAITTSAHWRQIAAQLTEIRRAEAWLPKLPGIEEWYDEVNVDVPFDVHELRAELATLSALIMKAHTLAAVYGERAADLDEWLHANAA